MSVFVDMRLRDHMYNLPITFLSFSSMLGTYGKQQSDKYLNRYYDRFGVLIIDDVHNSLCLFAVSRD